jgi:transketolase
VQHALAEARAVTDCPKAIVCHTTIGYGVPLVVGRERNHFVRVDPSEWELVAHQVEEES